MQAGEARTMNPKLSHLQNGASARGALACDIGKYHTGACLEGHGDLVSRLITGITKVTMWVIGVINLLTMSPLPSK